MPAPIVLLTRSLLFWLLGTTVLWADPGVLVVMNAASGVESLTRDQVVNIFLGRFRQLPNGMPALPIDQPADQPLKATFYQRLVNKQLAEIRAYWARLVFSGKTTPPRQAETPEQVLQWLAENPGAVAYLDTDPPSQVRIVFVLSAAP